MDFYAVAAAAAFLLLESSGFAGYLLWAVAIHECGHLAVILSLRAKVVTAEVDMLGVHIRCADCGLSRRKSLCITAAGCAANMAAAFLLSGLHSAGAIILSAANAALAALNLLPVRGSDGGELLRAAALRLFGRQAGEKICGAVSMLCSALLLCSALVYSAAHGRWLWGTAAAIFVLARLFGREVE